MTSEAEPGVKATDLAAPYMPFKTFTNLLIRMQQMGVPRRLDSNYLQNMSGATRSQLIAGLRWFDLIDADDRPQTRLTELVQAGEDRPAVIGRLFREHYAWALALAPENGTQGELDEAFRKHGVSGSTLRKATAFFLQGAKYASLPLSPFFRPTRTDGAGGSGTTRRRTSGSKKPKGTQDDKPLPETNLPPAPLRDDDPHERRVDALFTALLKKFDESTDIDADLLDRLERIAGTLPKGRTSTKEGTKPVQ